MTDYNSCDLHVPYKDWSGDQRERQNYEDIERWGLRLRSHNQPGVVLEPLHISAKGWSGDPLELQNYLAIERWARMLQLKCYKAVSGCC